MIHSQASVRILGLDGQGLHTDPQLGCDLQSTNVIVKDSRAGRQIEVGQFYASDPGKPLPEIARRLARAAHDGQTIVLVTPA